MYAFQWVDKQLIVRIVNILFDIVKYSQDMQWEDSQIK